MTENTQTVLNTVLARKSGKVVWPNLNAIQLTKQNVAQKLTCYSNYAKDINRDLTYFMSGS